MRIKPAPIIVSNFRQAKAAWDTYQRYLSIANKARAYADSYSGGTHSEKKHRHRYEVYSVAAAEWAKPLQAWISDFAQVEADDEKYGSKRK